MVLINPTKELAQAIHPRSIQKIQWKKQRFYNMDVRCNKTQADTLWENSKFKKNYILTIFHHKHAMTQMCKGKKKNIVKIVELSNLLKTQDSPWAIKKWANNTQDEPASKHPFVVLVVFEYKLFMQTLKLNNPNTKIGSKWVLL